MSDDGKWKISDSPLLNKLVADIVDRSAEERDYYARVRTIPEPAKRERSIPKKDKQKVPVCTPTPVKGR